MNRIVKKSVVWRQYLNLLNLKTDVQIIYYDYSTLARLAIS